MYDNMSFWQDIRNANALKDNRVILFCNYGSPTDNTDVKMPIIINEPQRISL